MSTAKPIGMAPRFLGMVLRAAVEKDDPEMVRSILASGGEPNSVEENGPCEGWTTAMLAASEGCAASLRVLLKFGADACARLEDEVGREGVSPAMEVAREGYADCLAELLDAGALVEERGRWNMTLAMIAATMNTSMKRNEAGKAECLRLLLERGASLREIDDTGRNLMDYAQEYGTPDFVRLVQVENERRIIARQVVDPERSANAHRL